MTPDSRYPHASGTPPEPHPAAESSGRICMHVQGTARTDGRVMREARALAEAGYTVTIVDVEREAGRPSPEVLDAVTLRHVIMPSAFIPTRFKPFFLVKQASLILRSTWHLLGCPADVYHAHDETALSASFVAASLRHKLLVYDAHEVPLVEPQIARWKRLTVVATHVLRALMRRCAAVITVSPPIVKELRHRYGGPLAVVVRNIPEYQPPMASDRLRIHLGLPPGSRIALYQGNLQADRSLEQLVLAGKYLAPGCALVLMGKGGLRESLVALAEREGVADRVFVLPAVPYEELLEWTASADVGLIIYDAERSPNLRMCLPNKLFEYLMAGVPVLATRLEAVEEVIRVNGVGQIVPSLDPAAIGSAVSGLLADGAALARFHANAILACRRELRWDVERGRLVALYERLIGAAADHSADASIEISHRTGRVGAEPAR